MISAILFVLTIKHLDSEDRVGMMMLIGCEIIMEICTLAGWLKIGAGAA